MKSMELFKKLSKNEYKNLSPVIGGFERRLNGLDFARLFFVNASMHAAYLPYFGKNIILIMLSYQKIMKLMKHNTDYVISIERGSIYGYVRFQTV
jgi:hypothetical protein